MSTPVSIVVFLAVLAWLVYFVATQQDDETLHITLRPWTRRAIAWLKRCFK